MLGFHYSIHLTSEGGNTYAYTKSGKWCFAYAGVNDHMWALFKNEEAAEEVMEIITEDWNRNRMHIQVVPGAPLSKEKHNR